MRLTKFKIKGYRSIPEIEFSMSYSITPIVGLNESGKTTILQALQAFDQTRDRFGYGKHLEYKNRYINSQNQASTISAFLVIEDDDYAEIRDKLSEKLTAKDINVLDNEFLEEKEIELKRHALQQTA